MATDWTNAAILDNVEGEGKEMNDEPDFIVEKTKDPSLLSKMSSDTWQFCIGLKSGIRVYGDHISAWTADGSWFCVEDVNRRTITDRGSLDMLMDMGVPRCHRGVWIQKSCVEWITEEDS